MLVDLDSADMGSDLKQTLEIEISRTVHELAR